MEVQKHRESSFVKACRGEPCKVPPVWLMRQAGRYLPEYRELRKQHSMMHMFTSPELACEVTLQPIRRFGFDAAIIFADILTPLTAMGAKLDFVEGTGPVIYNLVKTASDIEKLRVPAPKEAGDFTLEAIKQVTAELDSQGVPLIGFAGGPFTLSTYLMECGTADKGLVTKKFMTAEPDAWHQLQIKLVDMLTDYLLAQVEAGVAAIQIFESWLGAVSSHQYQVFVEPYLKLLFERLRQKTTVPLIFFSTATTALYREFVKLNPDVLGVDWRCSLKMANDLTAGKFTLQGNLDPHLLCSEGNYWHGEVKQILAQGKELKAHIFNLGHGILPSTPLENVAQLLSLIRES